MKEKQIENEIKEIGIITESIYKVSDAEIEARESCTVSSKKPTSETPPKGKPSTSPATALVNESEYPMSSTYCKQSHPRARRTTINDNNERRNLPSS